jgi:low affinity Fe/Cu permease
VAEFFRRFATSIAAVAGSYWAFVVALAVVVSWGLTGPLFGFSDTWQLIINTSTTIVTFLIVFLLQYDQNRNAKAIQVKLDELIRSGENARNTLVDAEEMSDEQLEELHEEFQRLRRARRSGRKGEPAAAGNSGR